MIFPNLLFYNDWGLFILRLAVAVIFLVHGLPKLKKAKEMAGGMGFPAWFVLGLGVVESLSALGLVLGVWIQVAALALIAVMIGAIYYKALKWNMRFAMTGATGWEFDLILLAANFALLLSGGGNIHLI